MPDSVMPNYVMPDSCLDETSLCLIPLCPIPLYLIPLLQVMANSVVPGSPKPPKHQLIFFQGRGGCTRLRTSFKTCCPRSHRERDRHPKKGGENQDVRTHRLKFVFGGAKKADVDDDWTFSSAFFHPPPISILSCGAAAAAKCRNKLSDFIFSGLGLDGSLLFSSN